MTSLIPHSELCRPNPSPGSARITWCPLLARDQPSQNNTIQGTRQHYLSRVATGRPSSSMKVKGRLKGAPDLCPFCGLGRSGRSLTIHAGAPSALKADS